MMIAALCMTAWYYIGWGVYSISWNKYENSLNESPNPLLDATRCVIWVWMIHDSIRLPVDTIHEVAFDCNS